MRAACAGLKGQRFANEQILRGPVGALRLAGLFAWYAPIQGCQTQFLEGCSPAALQNLVPILLQHTNHVVFK